jgi:ABC-type Mn2+/Zn2+ transport system ATPase subunit
MSRKVIVSFDNAGVSFGDFNVFSGVTMQVKESEIVSVVGPNGSGKTTLVRTLLGFVPVAEGSVTVFGEPPARLRKSGLAAYLPQEGGHDPTFPVTARDVIEMGLLSHKGLSERLTPEERGRVSEAVKLLDIEPSRISISEAFPAGRSSGR